MKKKEKFSAKETRDELARRLASMDPTSEDYRLVVQRIDDLEKIIEQERVNRREIAKIVVTGITGVLTMGVGVALTSSMNRAANEGQIDVTSNEKKRFVFGLFGK